MNDKAFATAKRALGARALLAGAFVLAATAVSQAQSYGFATYSAVVTSGGVLVHSSGVAAIVLNGTGIYKITFTRDVSTCINVASIASGFPGYIASNINVAQPTNVTVRTFGTNGVAKNFPFNVLVSCSS